MKAFFTCICAFVIALGLVACDGGEHKDHDHKDDASHKDHDHGKDVHEGHDHAKGGHDDGHGERHELGTADIGGFTVSVAALGDIKAGHEGVLDVEASGGAPSAVRAWVGVESAQGSLKAKLDKEGDDYHGHVEVPATLPAGSAVWIQIEDAEGKKAQASFKLK